jgi:hypothetical protein
MARIVFNNLSSNFDNSIDDLSNDNLTNIKGGVICPPPTGVAVIDDPDTGELVFVPFPICKLPPFHQGDAITN